MRYSRPRLPLNVLSTEFHQKDTPALFASFRTIVGERVWLDVADAVSQRCEKAPWMREYLWDQYRVCFALAECSQASDGNGGVLPLSITTVPLMAETFAFALAALQLLQAARSHSRRREQILLARVREAIREPRMMQAMQLEARVAIHFLNRKHQVFFPELGSSNESYDLLVETLGPSGLELECKVVTHDKGRKIHRAEARDFLGRLQSSPLFQAFASTLGRGLAVRITVPNRLPEEPEWERLIQEVTSQVVLGTDGVLPDGTKVGLRDFEVGELGRLENPVPASTVEAANRVVGVKNGNVVIFRLGRRAGALVIAIESELPDSMLHETFATLAVAAANQLTGRRAGAFMTSFEDIGAQALLELARDEGRNGNYSALNWATSRFLEQDDYPHVVGVGFLSQPDFASDASGTAYWFPRRTSSSWSEDFVGLFRTS